MEKRGFSLLYGVTTIIAYYTGKIIDLDIRSSYCQDCIFWKGKEDTDAYKKWYEQHKEECSANHSISTGKIEVDSILAIFKRSVVKYGVRFLNCIGDGDSKVFKAVLSLLPYGQQYLIKKSECVGHVEKIMSTRLRNVKK